MLPQITAEAPVRRQSLRTHACSARDIYFALNEPSEQRTVPQRAIAFLRNQLEFASRAESDLPHDSDELLAWMEDAVEGVGEEYAEYLADRESGSARRYFKNRSHALFFLKCVAPTKLVDGAWLYGVLPHWRDARFAALIETYIEELGEGDSSKNHVLLYKKLLQSEGCDGWEQLPEEYFVQGAIQLGLAYHAEHFLPEIVGYNLGYEQLPLHLLITAYELKELGIDPYYFTLHVTVDNADNGHARKAVDAVFDTMPQLANKDEWMRRVRNGYHLNFLGESTLSVINSFDIEREMITIFSRKGTVGRYAHSNGREIAGRSINDWLSDESDTDALLRALESEGWFQRHQDPQNSRFWKLIQSERAKMFGVFSAYEQQIIYDWIWGDAAPVRSDTYIRLGRRAMALRAKQYLRNSNDESTLCTADWSSVHGLLKWDRDAFDQDDFDAELRAFERRLKASTNPHQEMQALIEAMSPRLHHTPAGLVATRLFAQVVN